jgi:CRISPR-associated protein Csc2
MLLSAEIVQQHFLDSFPNKPTGRYAHIVLLRTTDSYAVFQTDGELNTARVQAGTHAESGLLSRLIIFKRKQSTPERLTGRELLRHYGYIDEACDYNVDFCKRCPDCIVYGFAIGQQGSEKSRVVVDTAFSITPYDQSHTTFTLNAPFENGTMSRQGETTERFTEHDHVQPQVFFPSIVTVRDTTEAAFLYVLNNVLRTRHYGAQVTRTGRVQNHVLGIVFADGEICSNLRLTQAVYDRLREREQLVSPDPLLEEYAIGAISDVLPTLLGEDGVAFELLSGDALGGLLRDLRHLTSSEAEMRQLLGKVRDEAQRFADEEIGGGPASKGRGGRRSGRSARPSTETTSQEGGEGGPAQSSLV